MNLDFGKSVPDLRFKGDQGEEYPEWKEAQLGRLFNISAGGDIEKSNVRKTKSDKFRFPVYANSVKNKGLQGYSNLYRVDKECITVSGRGTLGVAHARTGKFYPIVRLLVLISKFKCDLYFFEYAINALRIFNESTGVPQLTAPQLNKYRIRFPILEEQQKIANFLSSVDTRIEQLEKKKALLEQYKKGLMQKLFSQEIRFKDDQGEAYPEWKCKRFSSIAKKITDSIRFRDGKAVACIELENLQSNTGILVGNISGSEKKSTKTKFAEGDVLFGKLRPYLRKYHLAKFSGSCTSEIWVLRPNSITSEYLYFVIQGRQFFRAANQQFGSKMPRSDWNIVSALIVHLPSDSQEQQKIANFLSSIDKNFELVTEQINRTRDFKKGLLQQMFV